MNKVNSKNSCFYTDLPGDYICKKDDIGTEMFIIQSGQVQVLDGTARKKVLVTLGQGSVFGEIALLGVGGMNKRTADVISRGFSNLFVLQKVDLELVLKDYPDAKQILNARARRFMKENEARQLRETEKRKMNEQERKLQRHTTTKTSDANVIFPLRTHSLHAKKKKDPALLDTALKLLPNSAAPTASYIRKSIRCV